VLSILGKWTGHALALAPVDLLYVTGILLADVTDKTRQYYRRASTQRLIHKRRAFLMSKKA
jgi:hypothetical protein